MKATINRQLFIENISPIPTANGVSILIADGFLSVASLAKVSLEEFQPMC